MNNIYLSEAFKRMDALDEDIFEVDKDGLTELKDFEDSNDEEELITVVDPDAEDEEELEDSYIGKVILDCSVCHTDIYKNKDEIVIDDETDLANVGEECPYCYSSEGFKIIGEVKPFVETDFETEDDVDVEVDGEEVEEDEDMNESISRRNRRLKEDFDIKLKNYEKDSDIKDGYTFNFIVNGHPVSMGCWTEDLGDGKYGDFIVDFDDYSQLDFISEDELDDLWEKLGDIIETKVLKNESLKRHKKKLEAFSRKGKKSLKESCSINQCQKWVDYDMKKYKKISDDTMEKIKSSGYSVVKDQYGDYEVIADRKDESCGKRKSRKMRESIEDDYDVIDYDNDPNFKIKVGDVYNNGDHTIEIVGEIPPHTGPFSSPIDTGKFLYKFDGENTTYFGSKSSIRTMLNRKAYRRLRKNEEMRESIEDITIDTGDQEIQVSARDKEKEPTGDEMIAPLSDENKMDIEMNTDENSVDVDVDEFSEEDFDELGESYLKKVYENVESYKTISAKTKGNKLYLEGLIKFNSGKEKKTSFVFESKTITRKGKAKLIGENLQISKGHKSFKLTGTINNGKFISESLNYNYRVKNISGESQRVYGTAKKSK